MDTIKQLFYRYNPWWSGEFRLKGIILRESVFRKVLEAYPTKDIVLLTGLRRIGKTTLMRLLIQYLIREKKICPERIFYISLDEYSVRDMTLSEIIDEYRSIHKLKSSDEITLFLDEITSLPDYEIQLKNVYDMGGVKVFASSSSASVLRRGQAYITGRKRVIEIPPLDFEEYLKFKRIEISPLDCHLRKSYFEDFMKTGGIPEFVLSGDVTYLHQLVDDIICKDIAALHGIKHLGVLKDFFMLLMERAGKSVSINKMAKVLEISPDTAKRYLDLFQETYLVHLVSRKGKLNEQLRTPKKLYAADLGIRVLFTGYRDIGSLFENYVYLKISHRDPRFLIKDGIEIDFLTSDGSLIEVKYYSELRDKQQLFFDEYKAGKKLVISSVEDLAEFEEDLPELGYKVMEASVPYGRVPEVNLGRTPGLELLEKKYIIGIGCRRGVSFSDIEAALLDVLQKHSILREEITSIVSVDIKSDEKGLLELAKKWDLEIRLFPQKELNSVDVPNPSAKVSEKIGIPSVCEAAAKLAGSGELIVEKQKYGNVTVAVGKTATE